MSFKQIGFTYIAAIIEGINTSVSNRWDSAKKGDFVPGRPGTEKFVPSLENTSNYPHIPLVPTVLYYVALKLIIVNRDTLKCHTELGLCNVS